MKALIPVLLAAILLITCQSKKSKTEAIHFDDFMSWWTYHNANIHLWSDFEGRNTTNEIISKRSFLDSLKSGKYLAIKTTPESQTLTYALQKIAENNQEFSPSVKQVAEMELFNYNWENKSFPQFDFTDLDGNQYTTGTTKDKTIFLKTYFIACQACNEEMPELKVLTDKYQDNKNYIFLSLALDKPEKLKKFLESKSYKYHFVPGQNDFITNELRSNSYPTHFIIENGIVKKVLNSAREVVGYVEAK